MSSDSTLVRAPDLAEKLSDYVLAHGVREHPQLAALRAETAPLRFAMMQIGPEQGAFMALLAELMGVRRHLEVGVFTGYSSLAVALALPPEGRIVALDVSQEWTDIARRHWAAAGVAHKIELRLGPALQTLDALLAGGAAGSFDFAFVDADKTNYPGYYERCLALVRQGGAIAIDNAFQMGRVVDPARAGADAQVVDALNRRLHGDERVSLALLSIGDGLTLLRKR